METEVIPRIGRYWDQMGGLYSGVVRHEVGDFHVILAEPDAKRDMIYMNAYNWATKLMADGREDFRLPTRSEAALLYANMRDRIADGWMWTCDDYPADSDCKWVIAFPYGRNADARKTDACRARAVRLEPL